ncbi:MAG: hypothetical protein H6510_15625 [Acidobacteria bacterium]|nr:hypothetical protein [Acidobacteriota bacterium]MCB9399244.1 hypothetical protein [Acidobacteriota bacterium]
MATFILAIIIFGVCFIGMSIGFILRGISLKSSCGSAAEMHELASCGSCAKKEKELCPSDDDTGLLKIAELGNPSRTRKEHDDPSYRV